MIEVETTDKLDEVVNSLKVRITVANNGEIYFNQVDMVTILSEVSEQLINEDQREGFDFAIQFIERMGKKK